MAQKGWKIEDLMPRILTDISDSIHSLLIKEVRGMTKEGRIGFFMIHEYKERKRE